MPGLKKLRQRIASIRNTQKMTRAMHLVATTRLRGARASIEATRPYAQRIDHVMAAIHAHAPAMAERLPLFGGTGAERVHLIVVFTTDRGLCGGLNTGVVRLVKQRIARLEAHGREARILCIGRKGRRLLQHDHGRLIVGTIEQSQYRDVDFEHALPISERIMELFQDGAFDVCCQCYPRFRSILHQVPKMQQLIPLRYSVMTTPAEERAARHNGHAIAIYEPDEDYVLERLLRRQVRAQVYRALLECQASEEGARVAATDRATRNAGELLAKLSLAYNRQRQAIITREIIEIVAGMGAQNGS